MSRPLAALLLFLTLVAGVLAPAPASAHPADEANVYHYLWFEPTPGTLELQHAIVVGGLLTQAVWPEMDTDGDRSISEAESRKHAESLVRQITLRIDGRKVPWKLVEQVYPSHEEFFGRGMAAITLRLRAPLPETNRGLIAVRDETFLTFTGVFPKPVIKAQRLSTGDPLVSEEGRLTEFRLGASAAALPKLGEPRLQLEPDAGVGNMPQREPDLANAPIFPERGKILYAPGPRADREGHGETAALKDYLTRPLSPLLILIALAAALVAGMAHALTPGHGKAMVAAYLVGTRGTVRDAVLLGVVVTLTHTAGVYLLGFLCLWLTRQIRAEAVANWLGVASGLLVLGMGFWLFQRGLLAFHGVKPLPGHTHGEGGHTHTHETSHSHAHTHEPSAERRPPHDSPLESYAEAPAARAGEAERKGLLWLGVAGGIVPCFDALAILIAAVNLRRIELGLGLIAAFSLGMALVLVLVGVVFVKAKDAAQRFSGEAPWVRALPAVSGGILALLGAWLTFQALVQAGVLKN